MQTLFSDYVMNVPAQMRLGKRWFEGSADAIYQNLNLFRDEKPDPICVFGSDHVYRMDIAQMIDFHIKSGAGLTVAGIRVPRAQSDRFGIIEQRPDGRISRFREKPTQCEGLPDNPDEVMASMGNYVFRAETLIESLSTDARNSGSAHDMGGDIVTMLAEAGEAAVYDFRTNMVPGSTERDRGYWRDVGTLDSYYEAQMDLISVHPIFNLYNREWPIHTSTGSLPPAKFVFDDDGRRGTALDSMVSAGVVISGATVRRSIISSGATIHSRALVEDSVIMNDVRIGRGAVVRRAIIDKRVVVPPGAQIGVDHALDRANGYTVSESGVTVIGKGDRVAPSESSVTRS
jgi:glucose-1-phosphate adenylyltransferase